MPSGHIAAMATGGQPVSSWGSEREPKAVEHSEAPVWREDLLTASWLLCHL